MTTTLLLSLSPSRGNSGPIGVAVGRPRETDLLPCQPAHVPSSYSSSSAVCTDGLGHTPFLKLHLAGQGAPTHPMLPRTRERDQGGEWAQAMGLWQSDLTCPLPP